MFQNSIIPNELSIYKFLNEFNLNFQLISPQIKHLEHIMDSMILKGYNSKMYDVETLASQRHHTSISRFLSQSTWAESMITKCFQSKIVDIIWAKSKKTNKPIYIIIDDTISEKTKPSSKAINIIQKCSFHNSHLKGKTV